MKTQKEIHMEPHWQGMFAQAVRMVEAEMSQEQGRRFVVEMLQLGQRMESIKAGWLAEAVKEIKEGEVKGC